MSEADVFIPGTITLDNGAISAIETDSLNPKVRMDQTGFFATDAAGNKVTHVKTDGTADFKGRISANGIDTLAKTGAAIGQPDRELRWHNGQLTGKVVGAVHTTFDGTSFGSIVEISAGGQPNDGPAGSLADGSTIIFKTRAPDANLRSSFAIGHRPDLAAGSREKISFNIGGITDYTLMDDLEQSAFMRNPFFGNHLGWDVKGTTDVGFTLPTVRRWIWGVAFGTDFVNAAGLYGMNVDLLGVAVLGSTDFFFNTAGEHTEHAIILQRNGAVAAGNYTLRYNHAQNFDVNDRFKGHLFWD